MYTMYSVNGNDMQAARWAVLKMEYGTGHTKCGYWKWPAFLHLFPLDPVNLLLLKCSVTCLTCLTTVAENPARSVCSLLHHTTPMDYDMESSFMRRNCTLKRYR